MPPSVQSFSCPRCKRGEFRSLPGPDGKAFCPWCGDAVAGGPAASPLPATPPAVLATEASLGSAGLGQVQGNNAVEVPEAVVRVVRERIAELERRSEQAEADLRREQEKKQEIKKAVMAELGQLGSQLDQTKELLRRKEEELRSALAEALRLKEELGQERQKSDLLAGGARASLEEKEKAVRSLESEREELRKQGRETGAALDAARRDAEQMRSEFAKSRESSVLELAELRKKLAAGEARLRSQKDAGLELAAQKARLEESRGRFDKERAELQKQVSMLQSDLEKKDSRIRDLQLLIKTLGERLNDLTSRHF
jgi:chromosome segregation ATPase